MHLGAAAQVVLVNLAGPAPAPAAPAGAPSGPGPPALDNWPLLRVQGGDILLHQAVAAGDMKLLNYLLDQGGRRRSARGDRRHHVASRRGIRR